MSHTNATILSTLQYYLSDNPTIQNFKWIQNQTFASSPKFLIATITAYLSLIFILKHTIPSLPNIGHQILKPITAVHNLVLLILSLIMSIGCMLCIFSKTENVQHVICFPTHTKPSGPLFFWAYVFYMSKFLELLDTLLIILSSSFNRLTFLHVYHHATVLVMCYLWLQTSQSLFPVALVTNASVHVLMYGYYMLCAIGVRPRWKRLVTDCQIVQFVFSFLVSVLMVYFHFMGDGCSGMLGWCFNAVFNVSLLYLFVDFHSKSYANRKLRSLSDEGKKMS